MKTITVPKSLEAAKRLDFNECVEGDLLELNLDELSFNNLFEIGLIDILNSKLDIMIDDFEDEVINDLNKLEQGKLIVEDFANNNELPALKIIYELFKASLNYKTGVYFFF